MREQDDEKTPVDLNSWKKQKERAEREKARAKANAGGTINTSSAMAQKIALGLFILVVLWFAMPKDYFAIIRQSVGF